MRSVTASRTVRRTLRVTKRFVAIELHPAVYVSFVAVNLCVLLAYQAHRSTGDAQATISHLQIHSLDLRHDDFDLKPSVKEVSVVAAPQALVSEPVSEAVSEPVATVQPKPPGAVLAAVPVKSKPVAVPGKAKKKKRAYSGLVPPPPPGVAVVPPPPDAPSLFIAGAGAQAFLVAPPPPMVLDEAFDYPSTGLRKSVSRRSGHSAHEGAQRSRTVTHGNYKRVIVSR